MKNYLTYAIIAGTVLLFAQCTIEEIVTDKNHELKEQFIPEQFKSLIPGEYSIDWNASSRELFSEELGAHFQEFPIMVEEVNKTNNTIYDIKYSLMAIKQDSTYSFYIAKYFSDLRIEKGMNINDVSFLKYANFSGLIHLLDEANEMIYAKKLDRGEIIDHMLFYDIKKKGSENARFPGECYTLTTSYYTDWYIFVNGQYSYYESELRYTTMESYCNFNFYPELYTPGGGGGGNSSGGYQSSSGGDAYVDCTGPHPCIYELEDSYGLPTELIILDDPGDKILDINDYLKCFDLSLAATLTLYVDQPKSGTRETWSGFPADPDVGHTFLSITQGNYTRVIGFYPDGSVNPYSSNPSDSSTMVDDSGHIYDVNISTTLSPSELQNVLNYANSYPSTYNLNSYNCTDFGIQCLSKANINLLDTNGSWPGGGGSNPGDLGQDIRNMTSNSIYTVTKSYGTASSNSGVCN